MTMTEAEAKALRIELDEHASVIAIGDGPLAAKYRADYARYLRERNKHDRNGDPGLVRLREQSMQDTVTAAKITAEKVSRHYGEPGVLSRADSASTISVAQPSEIDDNYTRPYGAYQEDDDMARNDWRDDDDPRVDQVRRNARDREIRAMTTGAKAGIGAVVGEVFVEAVDEGIAKLNDGELPMVLKLPFVRAVRPIVYALVFRFALTHRMLDIVMPRGWHNRLMIATEYTLMGTSAGIVMKYGKTIVENLVTSIKKDGPVKKLLDAATAAEKAEE
jgi:hypothetical protein